MKPLPPLDVPWTMKPLESAKTTVEQLADGRIRFAIQHDLVRGVTPAMLVWWFNNMEGTVDIGGRAIPRYRAWHPRDHVALTYVRPGTDGRRFSAGAQIRIQEFFGARPEYKVNIVDDVDHLDETGMRHAGRIMGREFVSMDYRFAAVPEGTRYENSLTVGGDGRTLFGKLVNVVRGRLFPDAQGRAWLRHNVEEVGNLEHFLPALYAQRAT